LSDTGREQVIDMLEGTKLRHVDPERNKTLKSVKRQN